MECGEGRLMRFAGGPGTFPPVVATELLVDELYRSNILEKDALRGKLVVYGPTAPTFQDYHQTPYPQKMLGAELHLHAMNALLTGSWLRKPHDGWVFGSIGVAVVGLLLLCVQLRNAFWRMAVLTVVMGAIVWRVGPWLYAEAAVVFDFTPFLAVLAVGGAGTFVVDLVMEGMERARTRGFLERYVSKEVAGFLLENPVDYLATSRKPITILFSDVRGFTTLTEQHDAGRLVEQLNEYLSEMVAIVQKHRGTLDKFIGDAVMATWGHPYSQGREVDARNAVAAALEMGEALRRLNAGWLERGMLELRIGVGVNSGDNVVVGNMGSEAKMELTVIGDAVNLASRLEGYTKEYGVDFLLGEETARLLGEAFVLQPVDVVRVKGKVQPVEVWTAVGERGKVSEAVLRRLAVYQEGIEFFRVRNFRAARECFVGLVREEGGDSLAKLYVERCERFLREPPPEDWDGVTTFTTK